jgi:lambda family phage portal protein
MNLKFWTWGKQQDAEPKRARKYANVGAAMRMFEGAKADRLTADWPSFPVPAEYIIRMHQRVLVARSREQCANNDYAKAFLRMCRLNVVGPKGVLLQSNVTLKDGTLDTTSNAAIEAAFAAWGKRDTADIAGKLSWRAIQAACVVSAAKDGEFMLRKITGRKAGKFGFALQVLDPQRCQVDFDRYDLEGGNYIRAGIEFNEFGRPVAYYFTVLKDSQAFWNYQYAGNTYHRVPAEEIIHGYLEDMVGQKRGLPWMATGLFRMKQLNGFEDAAIVNARVGAAKMGFFQWKDGQAPADSDEMDAPEIEAEAGTFHMLPEGLELKEFNPQYPAGEFGPFMKYVLRSFAAGVGVPYNELAADLEGVNFSSIRQGTLDSREHWKELQEWLIEQLVVPVFEAWLPEALLRRRVVTQDGLALPAERVDQFAAALWQPRRWEWIDPRADVDGAVESKNNFLASPSQIIREQGKDPHGVWKETARDLRAQKDAMIAEGFSDETAEQLVMLAMGRPVPPPPKPAPESP